MVASMTAYSRERVDAEWGEAICEIRTLNHRYLELAIRLPDSLKALDHPIREKIANRLKRGKIDCIVHYKGPEDVNSTLAINKGLVGRIIATAESISQKTNTSAYINPLDILRWPGVISENELDLGNISADVLMLLDNALDTIVQTRNREGEKIKTLIEQRCKTAQQKIAEIQKELPAVREMQRKKLIEQISKLEVELDHDKLEQEVLFLARRQDIAEELDRLTVHIEEVIRVLAQTGPNGHRLDFLMQEMRRETNPLGAKSTHIGITNAAVDLKVLVEQMREQIQNIE